MLKKLKTNDLLFSFYKHETEGLNMTHPSLPTAVPPLTQLDLEHCHTHR